MVYLLDGEKLGLEIHCDESLCMRGKDMEEGFRLQGAGGLVQNLCRKEKEGKHGERGTRSIAT